MLVKLKSTVLDIKINLLCIEKTWSIWNITIKIDGEKIEPSTHVKYLGILINTI